uniref:Uncharacterized protein n=1 Tax=Monopterus albus TaxID=43700 RepID=A0A3Q3JF19_MONAL
MATNVFISNPQPQSPSVMAVHFNQWSSGICGCFNDLNVCCYAFWCLLCFICYTTSKFGECFCLPLLDIQENTSLQMPGKKRKNFTKYDFAGRLPPIHVSCCCSGTHGIQVCLRHSVQHLLAVPEGQREQNTQKDCVVSAQQTYIGVYSQPVIAAAPHGVM